MQNLYYKYGYLGVVVLVFGLTFIIVKPFFLSIVGAGIIAYIFYPLFDLIRRKTKRKNIAALLMILLVFLIVIIPSIFIANELINEIPSVYEKLSLTFENSHEWQSYINDNLGDFNLNIDFERIIESFTNGMIDYLQSTITSLPPKIIRVFMAGFLLFFLFRDGDLLIAKFKEFIPFSEKNTTIIFRELKNMADAVVYGQIITAIVQSILATIGYTILGVNSPFFWGIFTFIFSLIPMIGPGLVYLPIALSMIATSLFPFDNIGMIKGIFLLIYGIGVISTMDNIIKPILISDKVRMHPALILLGVFGGINAFGVIGVVLGPLTLVFLVTLFNIYEMKEDIVEKMEKTAQ